MQQACSQESATEGTELPRSLGLGPNAATPTRAPHVHSTCAPEHSLAVQSDDAGGAVGGGNKAVKDLQPTVKI